MLKIDIYTTPICPFCHTAKGLLERKNLPFNEINVAMDSDLRAHMIDRAGGRRTVPQIFINDTHIGGCDDLLAFDRSGELDRLISSL